MTFVLKLPQSPLSPVTTITSVRLSAPDSRDDSSGWIPESTRAATLPLVCGERLGYGERVPWRGAPQELGMRVRSLKRDQIEFAVDLAGQPMPGLWRQDLAGNPQLEGRTPLIAWQRLLKPDLQLGQVLVGDLHAADDQGLPAKLRGQVVAQGVQTVAARAFDVAVIELFGDAPSGESGSTRIDGVMAVDRRSGLLLRLELRCANAAFSLRRRLMRVEPPPG